MTTEREYCRKFDDFRRGACRTHGTYSDIELDLHQSDRCQKLLISVDKVPVVLVTPSFHRKKTDLVVIPVALRLRYGGYEFMSTAQPSRSGIVSMTLTFFYNISTTRGRCPYSLSPYEPWRVRK